LGSDLFASDGLYVIVEEIEVAEVAAEAEKLVPVVAEAEQAEVQLDAAA
jgi:hypothetical protein